MSERKFVIVDGSSLLSTCYYAVLPRESMFAKTDEEKEKHYGKILHASDGTYTNGIMGVLKAVASLLKKQQPAYMAFVFDKTRDTFRRELYPDYKGTRSRTPEPLKQQFVLMERILEEAGFKVLYSGRYEADDYAGKPPPGCLRNWPPLRQTYLWTLNWRIFPCPSARRMCLGSGAGSWILRLLLCLGKVE